MVFTICFDCGCGIYIIIYNAITTYIIICSAVGIHKIYYHSPFFFPITQHFHFGFFFSKNINANMDISYTIFHTM